MSNKFNIAVVGATGNVGIEILHILEQRKFPIDNIYLLASSRSKGKKIEFKENEIVVEDLADFDFSKVQIVYFLLVAQYQLNMLQKQQKKVV